MVSEDDRKSIDSLKGIAILGVVLVHYGINTNNEFINSIVANGARGVQLLFILNAYLIFGSLSKVEWNRKNIIIWLKKKFIRLIPLYWFFTILHLIVFGLGERYYLGPLSRISITNIICNLFFLHGFNPYYIGSINANWFMADLAVFYLLAPLLYKLINSLERAVISLLSVATLGYILWHFALGWNVLSVEAIWIDYVNILSFFSELPIMLIGILVYYIKNYGFKLEYRNLLSKIILFYALFMMLSLIIHKDYFKIFNNIFSFGILLALIFMSQLINPCRLISNSLFAVFGKHSYGIYLSQLFIIPSIKKILGGGYISTCIGYIATVVAALAIGVLSEKIIEKPILKAFS